MKNSPLQVAVGVIKNSAGEILISQRAKSAHQGGLWEFPGGKLEADETAQQALKRELQEELSIMVDETSLKPITFASHAYPDFHLLMPLFSTESWEGELSPREGQALAWVRSSDLHLYPAPAADIPLFDVLSGN